MLQNKNLVSISLSIVAIAAIASPFASAPIFADQQASSIYEHYHGHYDGYYYGHYHHYHGYYYYYY